MQAEETGLTYGEAGVETGAASGALKRLLYWVNQAEHGRCDGSSVGRVARNGSSKASSRPSGMPRAPSSELSKMLRVRR